VYSHAGNTDGTNRMTLATRATTADPFVMIGELPIDGDASLVDADAALSADGCELVFTTDRGASRDLYSSTVQP
jgi:hypothetical protein